MILLAIDPGTEQSAWLCYDTVTSEVTGFGIEDNNELSETLTYYEIVIDEGDDDDPTPIWETKHLAIEGVECFGMPVGSSTLETCEWIGEFRHAYPFEYTKCYRKDIKLHLCGSLRAKDANVRQALIDRFPATGGGKTPQVGTKKQPGPLYGMKSHLWSALAVAVYWSETHEEDAT